MWKVIKWSKIFTWLELYIQVRVSKGGSDPEAIPAWLMTITPVQTDQYSISAIVVINDLLDLTITFWLELFVVKYPKTNAVEDLTNIHFQKVE